MHTLHSFRILFILGFSLVGCQMAHAGTVLLNNEPDMLLGNGAGANGGGIINGTVEFSTRITTTNANNEDSASFQAVDNVLRTWIDDASNNQADWNSTFVINFPEPINGLKVVPDSPQNNSDSVIWNVQWTGRSNQATLINSPNAVNEYSLYQNGSRLPNGLIESGTPFRLDDDASPGEDTNGTDPNDLNIGIPSTPWSIDLPNEITSLTVQARVDAGGTLNMAFEGIGIDFSAASLVPEPSSLIVVLELSLVAVLFFRRPRSL